jgi:SAM-dependent methyltransferase
MTEITKRSPWRAAVEYPARRAARKLTGRSYARNAQAVLDEYEEVRRRFLEKFLASDWSLDEFVHRDADGRGGMGRTRTLRTLRDAVARYEPETVLEVGSGTGRNVLHLCSTLGVKGIGLELTEAGTATGNAAAERYGLAATFQQADMREPWTITADVAFSVHALEQIPDAGPVIDRMQAHARKAVVMIEPFPDFWHGVEGFASRQRAIHLDRLRPGSLEGRKILTRQKVRFGDQLNLPTEVHLQGTA